MAAWECVLYDNDFAQGTCIGNETSCVNNTTCPKGTQVGLANSLAHGFLTGQSGLQTSTVVQGYVASVQVVRLLKPQRDWKVPA